MKKKKYFVCSDVHGFYTEMMNALIEKGFDINNPNHILIVCGDLLDRGNEARKMVDFIFNLLNSNRCLLVRGNHEDLFEAMIERGDYYKSDITNGTFYTLDQLQLKNLDIFFEFPIAIHSYEPKWDYIRKSMKDYIEIDNYIFVHGWIPSVDDWRNASSVQWDSARWKNGMSEAMAGHIEPGKTIVCGHWHASYGNVRKKHPNKSDRELRELEFSRTKGMRKFKPYYSDGIIAIDACTAYTGFVNVIVLNLGDYNES